MRTTRMAPCCGGKRAQRGVMLLEALIAILIFSIGILGLMGLQATAVKQSTDARYRSQAAQLADQLVGQMWSGDRTVANLRTQYNTCGTTACGGYQGWFNAVNATLPGVSPTSNTRPTVSVDNDGVITISVFWRAPTDDDTTPPHRYQIETQIGQ
jgi:type IV pilus assembly protein PilV